MHSIIDAPLDIGSFGNDLARAGVRVAIRYYNHRNSTSLPTKCLSSNELTALRAAGIDVAVVFQQRGGAGGNLGDFTSRAGRDDAARCLTLAENLQQPDKTAIYFAVDWDFYKAAELRSISEYFASVKDTLDDRYSVGVYGSGTVGLHLKTSGLVDYVWLSGSLGWSGTRDALKSGEWTLFQKYMNLTSSVGGFPCDGNISNPAADGFGQFGMIDRASEIPQDVRMFEITARSGLNLRAGPGETYRVMTSLPAGQLVHAVDTTNGWVAVDLQGDGRVDGYVFGAFLRAVSGGFPAEVAHVETALDVALAELALSVAEIPGAEHNPRIVMYHASTKGGPAPDETAWCSSFVSYCVEKSGMRGTRSKRARTWHDRNWGNDVTANPLKGDIVVFSRENANVKGGHVGFYIDETQDRIRVLGGNQSNRVSYAWYPKDGIKGPFHYRLLSIRRG